MGKWLVNIEDGTLYHWSEVLARHPKCRELTTKEVKALLAGKRGVRLKKPLPAESGAKE